MNPEQLMKMALPAVAAIYGAQVATDALSPSSTFGKIAINVIAGVGAMYLANKVVG